MRGDFYIPQGWISGCLARIEHYQPKKRPGATSQTTYQRLTKHSYVVKDALGTCWDIRSAHARGTELADLMGLDVNSSKLFIPVIIYINYI